MPSMNEIIKQLSFQYRSIDVRVACSRLGGDWASILTAIRFSYNTPDMLPIPDMIQTDDFKTIFWPLGIDRWNQLRNAFVSHQLKVGDDIVNMERETADVDTISYNLTPRSSYFQEYEWPQYDGAMIRHSDIPGQERINAITQQLRAKDYNDIYQAISQSLRVHYNQSSNNNQYLMIALPVYAKIEEYHYDGDQLRANIKFHERLKVCRILAQLLPGESYSVRTAPRKQQFARSLADYQATPSLQKDFFTATVSDKLPGGVFSDSLYLGLRLDGVIVDEHYDQVERCLHKFPEKLFGNAFPMVNVLERFCSFKEFANQLLSPESCKDPARVFERAVSWLLASSGVFCVLKLDEFEKLTIKDSKFDKGSVDLLAFAPLYSALYVVSCTLGLPQEKEISNIRECSEYLSRELFPDRPVKLLAVLITTKMDTSRARDECVKRGIQLVDGTELRNLVEKLRLGDAKGFISFWGLN